MKRQHMMQMKNGLMRMTPVVASMMAMGSLALGTSVSAQGTSRSRTPTDSSVYLRAQEMVSNGDAGAGRALVDSMLKSTTPDTPPYAEALYWRATLAPTATDAERDYRRIVVDYALSPRVDDALLRMGQLELTRGARDAALQHFQRLTLEHPDSPFRAKASFWTARALFEKNDLPHACAANADALARVRASDIELKNQIDFQNQRCRGVAVASSAAPAPVAVPEPAVAANDATVDAPAPPAAAATDDVAPEPVVRPATKANPKAAPAAAVKAAAAPVGTGKFAVQVAAYYDRVQADALAAKLRARGYSAHVDGTAAPFRVRIGSYKTHAQAATALTALKTKKIDGFVTGG